MLLLKKIKQTKFSPNEQIVIDFIREKQEQIEDYSTTMIAGETYTSPSVLVRIAKKLEFNGWIDLRKAYVHEINYLRSNFQELNANIPFQKNDSFIDITTKIAQIKKESLNDSLSLMEHEKIQQAVSLIKNQAVIQVYALSNLLFLGEEFAYKLRHVRKQAEVFTIQNTMYQEAAMCSKQNCAILISYSGESPEIIKIAHLLKQGQVPIIAITSIGENSLSKLATITLPMTTREKSYSKIAGFSSLESISFILDTLYACYFSTDFDNHYNQKINLARLTESRQIDNNIIEEN